MECWNEDWNRVWIGPCTSLTGISDAAYKSITQLMETGDWVDHTHQVLETLESVISDERRRNRPAWIPSLLAKDTLSSAPFHMAQGALIYPAGEIKTTPRV